MTCFLREKPGSTISEIARHINLTVAPQPPINPNQLTMLATKSVPHGSLRKKVDGGSTVFYLDDPYALAMDTSFHEAQVASPIELRYETFVEDYKRSHPKALVNKEVQLLNMNPITQPEVGDAALAHINHPIIKARIERLVASYDSDYGADNSSLLSNGFKIFRGSLTDEPTYKTGEGPCIDCGSTLNVENHHAGKSFYTIFKEAKAKFKFRDSLHLLKTEDLFRQVVKFVIEEHNKSELERLCKSCHKKVHDLKKLQLESGLPTVIEKQENVLKTEVTTSTKKEPAVVFSPLSIFDEEIRKGEEEADKEIKPLIRSLAKERRKAHLKQCYPELFRNYKPNSLETTLEI